MKSIFLGHFRPTEKEFSQLWDECIFAVDANVLLNLYRYSEGTRAELEKALKNVGDRVFIPHQAAKEFLKNRLNVTAGQASEYGKSIQAITKLVTTLSTKDRHPFLPAEKLGEFKKYTDELKEFLAGEEKILLKKLTNDEILEFIESLFSGKTGEPYNESQLQEIKTEGETRYLKKAPPGYKDMNKDGSDDPYRAYGDLIVWKQIIAHAQTQNKPVVFITDDKKEDWWLEQSERTIGPRPELIEEFNLATQHRFWMYTVNTFIKESARKFKTEVSPEVFDEIRKISLEIQKQYSTDIPSIEVNQDTIDSDDQMQAGLLFVTLNKPMRYATGTGRFRPEFENVPHLEIDIVETPNQDDEAVGISYGCGTTNNFNVHLNGKGKLLESGEYVFRYEASLPPLEQVLHTEITENEPNKEVEPTRTTPIDETEV